MDLLSVDLLNKSEYLLRKISQLITLEEHLSIWDAQNQKGTLLKAEGILN